MGDRRLLPMERVLGFTVLEADGEQVREVPAAIPLKDLAGSGALNFTVAEQDLVAFHAPGASSALDEKNIPEGRDVGATGLFSSHVADRKLTFNPDGSFFVDEETGSVWTITGLAVDGCLAGERLEPVVHYDTFWFVWVAFKPGSVLWGR